MVTMLTMEKSRSSRVKDFLKRGTGGGGEGGGGGGGGGASTTTNTTTNTTATTPSAISTTSSAPRARASTVTKENPPRFGFAFGSPLPAAAAAAAVTAAPLRQRRLSSASSVSSNTTRGGGGGGGVVLPASLVRPPSAATTASAATTRQRNINSVTAAVHIDGAQSGSSSSSRLPAARAPASVASSKTSKTGCSETGSQIGVVFISRHSANSGGRPRSNNPNSSASAHSSSSSSNRHSFPPQPPDKNKHDASFRPRSLSRGHTSPSAVTTPTSTTTSTTSAAVSPTAININITTPPPSASTATTARTAASAHPPAQASSSSSPPAAAAGKTALPASLPTSLTSKSSVAVPVPAKQIIPSEPEKKLINYSTPNRPQPPRPPSSHASNRSSPTPPKKRAPARFSSNGVATSAGPPPSLAFRQRRPSMDHNRSLHSVPSTPLRSTVDYSSRDLASSSTSSATMSARPISRTGTAQGQRHSRTRSSSTMQRRQSFSSFSDDDDDDEYGEKDRTIRGLEDLQNHGAQQPKATNEDVFLKLARADSGATRAADRLERRRARLSQNRNSVPIVTQSSPVQPVHDFNSSPPQVDEDVWRRARHRMSSPPGDFRSHRMSQAEDRERNSVTPRPFDLRPVSVLRRDNSHSHTRSYSVAESNRPNLSALTRGLTASPHIDEKDPDRDFTGSIAGGGSGPRSSGSVSTASTTAASSVWDELDDLKSRIRRLEVTGRIPASGGGNASNSSGDRPRTATTTITTVSSSPRNNANGISPMGSSFTPTTTSHPLLHNALAKTKAVLPADVYKHLELAAKDALDMANTVGAPGSGAPSVAGVDRNVRRKADGVCRSLTELCLALSENRQTLAPPAPLPFIQSQFLAPRPISRGLGTESVLGVRTRDMYDGGRESAIGERLPSRVASRFADRKHSLASLSVAAGFSPRSDTVQSPTVRHRGSMQLKEGFSEDRFRAPSRAGEANGHRLPTARHSMPREYTTTDVASTLPPRRSSFAPTIQSSPLAPSKRSSLYSSLGESGLRTAQEFTMTGGPINERLASALNSQDQDLTTHSTTSRFGSGRTPLTSKTSARRLRPLGESDRATAIRRAEAATERLVRR